MSADRVRSNNAKKFNFKVVSLTAISGLILLSLFQNCAKHDGLGGEGLGSASCEPYMKSVFDTHIYGYAVTYCSTCHVPNGQGKGKFATNDQAAAWGAFSVISDVQTKFYNNSISTSHAPGVTGPQLEGPAANIKQALKDAETACLQNAGGGLPGISVQTSLKEIGLEVGGTTTLSWILSSELSPEIGDTGGAVLFVDVQAVTANYYYISRPRIRTVTQEIYVKGMEIIINGEVKDTVTLFNDIDKLIPPGTSENTLTGILTEQGSTIPAVVDSSDTLIIGFEVLQIGAPETEEE
ncbi:MAG: hypothetical protein KDD58_01380 [Bdellovibrionales bacterium]|nr:hypothetical protein [Bdellovibrionales bacterium]